MDTLTLEAGGDVRDAHYGVEERTLSLLYYDGMRVFLESPGGEACLKRGRFRENILVEGEGWERLERGDLLRIGTAQLRITSARRKCPLSCGLDRRENACALGENSHFASVSCPGEIRMGDEVRVVKKGEEDR
ncbi:MAG: MOSC domain-containing protein [Candidatus Undinarchaeales archaeon]|nr:MOSC domain-containing protein [Candidatus Undinarchaeales archaeon]MDP7491925.1 MOSC domain-containing protein [Candidatus Undinarchaeales archaeon]